MSGICEGRVVVITGAGRGIGREYARAFAGEGARVVVNDIGGAADGSGASLEPADSVVNEIREAGGQAVASGDDVSDWDGARRLVDLALTTYGDLDVLVNNAGILRDRMLVNMTADEWDDVVRVHLRGTVAPLHHAAAYWRDRVKSGHIVDARVVNTTSSSGLYCNPGQGNYGAAKAGIAALTVIAARELDRYGVTVNAVYPTALSRLTASVLGMPGNVSDGSLQTEDLAPSRIAPLVVWLGSPQSRLISGRVFGVRGDRITVAEGWRAGRSIRSGPGGWDARQLTDAIPGLVAQAAANVLTTGLPAEPTR